MADLGRRHDARLSRGGRAERQLQAHGVVVAAVPWARHDSSFTRQFEDQVAWLTVQASKTAVSQLMRIAWRTVGWICERVSDEALQTRDLCSGLTRIGVDEISIRKGQRYLTVVVDHDTGRLVWAAPGRDRKTVEKFLDLLGKQRCHQLKLVSCDMASWITGPIAERCPNASVCYDPFHLVALATDALDEIRREVWNDARRQGQAQLARELKGARFALWKNPSNLTERQQLKLARVQQLNQRLYRAYLLAQQLREIYRVPIRPRDRAARRLGRLGQALPAGAVRQARQHDHRAARRDRIGPSPRTIERSCRASQHTAATDHPPSVRVPLTSRRNRARDARPRRTLPLTPRPVTQPTVHAGDPYRSFMSHRSVIAGLLSC